MRKLGFVLSVLFLLGTAQASWVGNGSCLPAAEEDLEMYAHDWGVSLCGCQQPSQGYVSNTIRANGIYWDIAITCSTTHFSYVAGLQIQPVTTNPRVIANLSGGYFTQVIQNYID